jgi:hypothetical protein
MALLESIYLAYSVCPGETDAPRSAPEQGFTAGRATATREKGTDVVTELISARRHDCCN